MPEGQPNKRYTPEFKIKVAEAMHNEKLSYREAARQFEISDHNRISGRERIYLEEGAEGLRIERRERKSTGRPAKLKKEAEEDLDIYAEIKTEMSNFLGSVHFYIRFKIFCIFR